MDGSIDRLRCDDWVCDDWIEREMGWIIGWMVGSMDRIGVIG
jgi:hypothetical protein